MLPHQIPNQINNSFSLRNQHHVEAGPGLHYQLIGATDLCSALYATLERVLIDRKAFRKQSSDELLLIFPLRLSIAHSVVASLKCGNFFSFSSFLAEIFESVRVQRVRREESKPQVCVYLLYALFMAWREMLEGVFLDSFFNVLIHHVANDIQFQHSLRSREGAWSWSLKRIDSSPPCKNIYLCCHDIAGT
jgi:hypothetical protein